MDDPQMEHEDVPSGRVVRGVLVAPPSKSHAIRLLVAAALARGTSAVSNVPDGDDVRAVVRALRTLGIDIQDHAGVLHVRGCGGELPRHVAPVHLDLGGSGTGLRILAAVCCLGSGPYVLTGDVSLRARPVGSVVDVVERLGCRAETTGGCAPLTITGGPARSVPAALTVPDLTRSSQPLSALLLAAAPLSGGVTLDVPKTAVSRGYVDLTCDVLARYGVQRATEVDRVRAGGGGLVAVDSRVEGDWSSAAFLLAAAAATGGAVHVRDVSAASAQPDAAIVPILRAFGADVSADAEGAACEGRPGTLRPVDVALTGSPDLAPLVGALGCLTDGVTRVMGTPHLRIKESDRIASVVAAARAVGCRAEERPDGFVVEGGGARGGTVDPCGDHRLAMAFAVAGLAIGGVRIVDPGCVAKSYPGFWADLARLIEG